MKAISLWQPYASAIPLGLKKIETRHWTTNHRGPLAIHAAKKRSPMLDGIARIGGIDPSKLLYGYVVATAYLECVLPSELLTHCVSESERYFGVYDPERFGWMLKDIQPITPFPFKGGQGFFNIPDELFI